MDVESPSSISGAGAPPQATEAEHDVLLLLVLPLPPPPLPLLLQAVQGLAELGEVVGLELPLRCHRNNCLNDVTKVSKRRPLLVLWRCTTFATFFMLQDRNRNFIYKVRKKFALPVTSPPPQKPSEPSSCLSPPRASAAPTPDPGRERWIGPM